MGRFLEKKFDDACQRMAEYLESPYDLVGEGEIKPIFLLCSRVLEKSLCDDPDVAIPEKGVKWRKKVFPLIRGMASHFMIHKQVIEDKTKLEKPDSDKSDAGTFLPEEPVIYASNHGFYDDIAASVRVSKRPVYLFTSGVSEVFNTAAGIALWMMGIVLLNSHIKRSRRLSIEKAKKVLNCGTDLLIYPEGVWNKTPNLLSLPLHRGIYRIAKETGAKVVPIIHYVADPVNGGDNNPIHTVIDEAISFEDMSEREALSLLRDRFAYWYYIMMERYGTCKREDIIREDQKSSDVWGRKVIELLNTYNCYDSKVNRRADYRPKEIVRAEDVFEPIARISEKNITAANIKMIIEAQNIVCRREEDFQRRY